jgi:hypothetical protein
MYCTDNYDTYQYYMKRPPMIVSTPGVIQHIPTRYYTQTDVIHDKECFTLFMTCVIFPMLYSILTTGSIQEILRLFIYIREGVFDGYHSVKRFMMRTLIQILRIFGLYTFSTYTVVKDGKEVFSATSEYFFMKSTRSNIKLVDRAKYRVCTWIDNECELYRLTNNDDEPELTEKHNDIYDFIIHTFDNDPRVRIHRGDFRISTRTLLYKNYHIFCKSYQISNTVEMRVSLDNGTTTEVIYIPLKNHLHYYLEKNIVLDKKFLRWYLYNKLGRKDVSDYLGLPDSKYEVIVYYEDYIFDDVNVNNNSTTDRINHVIRKLSEATTANTENVETDTILPKSKPRAFRVNEGQYILVGSRYMIKVDSILHCPVFETGDHDVFHVDDVLTNYYEESECSKTDTEYNDDEITKTDADADTDTDTDPDADTRGCRNDESNPNNESFEPEFEIIEPTTN